MIGSVVQELALPSGRVLFEWRSLDHVAIEESYADYTGHAYDYFHINSIDVDADGNLLVSARNTWAVYKLDRETGQGPVAPRGKAERLPDGGRDRVRLAARRPTPRRGPSDQHLRQRRRAARPAEVACPRDRPRSAGKVRAARAPVRTPTAVARAVHGQRTGAAGRQRRRRLGRSCRTSPSSTATAESASMRGCLPAG